MTSALVLEIAGEQALGHALWRHAYQTSRGRAYPMPILVCNLLVSRYLHGLRIGARLTSHANELVRLTVLGPSARRVDSDLYLMTSRELTFGHVVISASPCCIFPYNLMQDIFIQSKVIDVFPKFKMAAAAILDFQFI